MSRLSVTVSALALIGALASNPAEANQRVFVASFGSDANTAVNCTLVNPCRGFAAAMTVVDSGGEVVALDAAGYAAVTITKSVTITSNPGFYAGISAPTGNGVTIATAGVHVILRGLNINGTGGTFGVVMSNGDTLSIENCIISNFAGGNGVDVGSAAKVRIIDSMIRENNIGVALSGGATATISGTKVLGNSQGVLVFGLTPSTTTTAAVSDSVVSGNGGIGITVFANVAGSTARASVTRSTVSNNNQGIHVEGGPGTQIATISNNLVTGNTNCGLCRDVSAGTSTLNSLGNNTVDQNGFNTSGTITPMSGL